MSISKENYITKKYNKCPWCNSSNIYGKDQPTVDDNTVYQPINCKKMQ